MAQKNGKKKSEKPRPVGRPKGTGTGRKTEGFKISLPHDAAAWLKQQPNRSAAITDLIRAHLNLPVSDEE